MTDTCVCACVCVCVMKLGDASKVKVYGPAIEAPVKAYHVSYLIVDCKEAGPGTLYVCLSVCLSVCLLVSVCLSIAIEL